jgi:outer membrane protein assembly factor BamB
MNFISLVALLTFIVASAQYRQSRYKMACATDEPSHSGSFIVEAGTKAISDRLLDLEPDTPANSQAATAGTPLLELWHTAIERGSNPPTCTPAANDKHLFMVASDIQAYTTDSGQLLWRTPLRSYTPRSLVTAHDRVFVAELTVSAFEGATGRRLWEFTPDGNASMGRAVTDGRTLYFGTSSHRLYALRVRDGKKLWSTDLGRAWKHPAVVRGVSLWGDKLYVAIEQWQDAKGRSSTGWLIAVHAKSGKILWRYNAGAEGQRLGFSSSPLATPDLVIAADYLSNALVAVNRKSGREVWKFQGEKGFAGFPEAPVIADGILYAGSGDTYVYALDPPTGRLIWRAKLGGSVENYAACGHRLLVNDQELAVFDLLTGQILQRALNSEQDFPTSGPVSDGDKAFLSGPTSVHAFRCR